MISIQEAAEQGIDRLRRPEWACKFDHVKIDIIDGHTGPWLHLFSPANVAINGRDPANSLVTSWGTGALDAQVFVPYNGPLPDSTEYKAEREKWSPIETELAT